MELMENVGAALLLLAMILAYVVICRSYRGAVAHMMGDRSSEAGDGQPEELARSEMAVSQPLKLSLMRASTRDPAAARAWQTVFAADRRVALESWLISCAACFGYVAVPLLAVRSAGLGELGDQILLPGLVATVHFLVVSLRYLCHRRRLGLGPAPNLPFGSLLREITRPRYAWILPPVYVALGLFAASWWPIHSVGDPGVMSPGVAKGFLLASALHALLHGAFRSILGRRANRPLLILRVFGDQEQARFTFGQIARIWGRIGNAFTIFDPALLDYRNRLFSVATLRWLGLIWSLPFIVLAVTLGLPAVVVAVTGIHWELWLLAVYWLVLGIVLYRLGPRLWKALVGRSFVRSRQEIDSAIARAARWPRGRTLGFRQVVLRCFDNTWKLAVAALVRHVDAVLMDLRGFSAENRGCEYEVDFLFDNLPLERLVFVVDESTDLGQLERFLDERWRLLREGTPNLTAKAPRALVYVSREATLYDGTKLHGSFQADDVRGVMELLARAAIGSPAPS